MKLSRIEFAERASVAIAKLHPTAAEDELWALERPRHSRAAFAKFGLVPGLGLLTLSMVSRGSRPHHWWLWLILAGISGLVSVMTWLLMWRGSEEPKLRLRSLRLARLQTALSAYDAEDHEPAYPRENA